MKRLMAAVLTCSLMAVALSLPSLAVEPVQLQILYPSNTESTISPGRDFYVIGKISGTVPDDACMTVSLLREGESIPLRTVSSSKKDDQEGLFVNYEGLSCSSNNRTALKGCAMPDLVYDPAQPETFRDAWRKCYYNDRLFTALISGGKYRTGILLQDSQGRSYAPLTKGSYTVLATLEHSGMVLASASRMVILGDSAEKVITRFSPSKHLTAVTADAIARGYRLYLDPLPGYWAPTWDHKSLFCEIASRWKQSERAEYAQGCSHFYIYNITQNCTSNTVEIGLLQQQNVIDDPARLVCHYYDVGEPSLPYLPERKSQFLAFDQGQKLVYTRTEVSDQPTDENFYNEHLRFSGLVDFDLTDGIAAHAGQTISFYGVTAPIQNLPYDLVEQEDHSVLVHNRISSLRYTITMKPIHSYHENQASREVTEVVEKPVGLVRSGSTSPSIYEFKHSFFLRPEMENQILTFSVDGLDTRDNEISGTLMKFSIAVGLANGAVIPLPTLHCVPQPENPATGAVA